MKTDTSSYFWIDEVSHNDFLVGVLNFKKSTILSQKSLLDLKKANSYELKLQSKFLKILGNIAKTTNSVQKKFNKHAPEGRKGDMGETQKSGFSYSRRGNDLDEELLVIQKKLKELGNAFN